MIPNSDDPRWRRALLSQSDVAAASLATKILISRLRQDVKTRPAEIQSKINELRAFFEKHAFAQKDLALL
jgi:hypothetical protein